MSTRRDTQSDIDLELLTPREYHVFILNDDYTPVDFVIDILMTIFHKNYQEAEAITLMVHEQDRGLCGVFSHEVAETKVMQVTQLAKEHGHPLKSIMEEV